MPSETGGLLLGSLDAYSEGEVVHIIKQIKLLDLNLLRTQRGLEEWLAELALVQTSDIQAVGWFYADPGIGIFSPRIDPTQVHEVLFADSGLLLLSDPAHDQGAFYSPSGNGTFTVETLVTGDLPQENGQVEPLWSGGALPTPRWMCIAPTSSAIISSAIQGEQIVPNTDALDVLQPSAPSVSVGIDSEPIDEPVALGDPQPASDPGGGVEAITEQAIQGAPLTEPFGPGSPVISAGSTYEASAPIEAPENDAPTEYTSQRSGEPANVESTPTDKPGSPAGS